MAAVFVAVAGDGERHAGLPPALQREAERFKPLTGAQRSDHHGERPQTTRRATVTMQKWGRKSSLDRCHPQALYDYLPSENDLQPLLAWLAVMEKAHVHLAR